MTGSLAASKLNGTSQGTSAVTLTGECRTERALFDKTVYAITALFEGSFDGSVMRIHHLLDPEHFRPELVLEAIGSLLAGSASPE